MDRATRDRHQRHARVFKALGHATRLVVVRELGRGERCVQDPQKLVGSDLSTVSKHLSVLREAGVLGRRKQGTSAYYRIVDESIFELCDLVCGSIHDRLLAELDGFDATPRS